MNSFTTVIYTFQGVKTYNNWTVREYKCLFLTFIFLQIARERERERESGIQNLGIKENGPKVTYLIFRRGSTGESFFFHGLIDFALFFLHWLEEPGVLRVSVFFFFCLQPGVQWLWFVCPLRTLLKN